MTKAEEGEYAKKGGVNYTHAEVLRDDLIKLRKRTFRLPKKWGVTVDLEKGATHYYSGPHTHRWKLIGESLGNQNWIAALMEEKTGKSYQDAIAWNLGQIIVIDALKIGAMPAIWVDIISSNSYAWGMNAKRRKDFTDGLYDVCKACGMALTAGDSSALPRLVKSQPPVKSAPVLTGAIDAIIAPADRVITGDNLQIGDHIIAAPSSGVQMNGLSLVIERTLGLKDQFLHELSNGNTLGAEALIPAACYVDLVDALLKTGISIHAIVPGTGSGLSKLAFDKRRLTYHVKNWWDWEAIPLLFRFMKELGVSLDDLLTTFNMKGGIYFFVPAAEIQQTIRIGKRAGYELLDVGVVKKGTRKVVIDPGLFGNKEPITLPPPGG